MYIVFKSNNPNYPSAIDGKKIISMINNNRQLLPDIARTLCMLEIVAFWHLFDYIDPVNWQHYFKPLTLGSLGCFTFLSGLFLGKKEMAFKKFYLARLIRFMPLLMLALVMFYILHMVNAKTMILSAVGISCFYPPQPLTLWFFAMMIVFYFVTPFLLHHLHIFSHSYDLWIFLARATIFYCMLIMFHIFFPTDYRLLVYYPFYVGGILFPISSLHNLERKWYLLLTFAFLLLVTGIKVDIYVLSELMQALGSVILILLTSSILEKIKKRGFVYTVEFMSYISMTAYLFHRVVYSLVLRVFHVEDVSFGWILAMITILFISAFIMQKGYDKIIEKYR